MKRIFILTALLLCIMSSGCVKRELRIETLPAEADIYLDGKLIGKSPVIIPFEFYCKHLVRIEKDGYYTQTIRDYALDPPVYEYFPIDFFSENVLPMTLNDEHILHVTLEQRPELNLDRKDKTIDEVMKHADTLKKKLADD